MKWIKINDRLPDERGYYHVKAQYDGKIYPEGCQYSPEHEMWGGGLDGNIVEWLDESPSPQAGSEMYIKPKVVCFCGSTRFAEWFMIKRWELEKQGIITFGINILPDNYFAEGNSHGAEQEKVKDILDELHKRKIDLSDEVFILNVGGYIGESTRNELNYAIEKGKPVIYLEPIN